LNATGKALPEDLHYCAVAIINTVKEKAAGKGFATRDEVLDGLAALKLKTTQAPIRILYYWKKNLIDNGYLTQVSLKSWVSGADQ
jgi:hypothetical protein